MWQIEGEVLIYDVNSLMFQSKKVKQLACFTYNNKMNRTTSYSKSTATTNVFSY